MPVTKQTYSEKLRDPRWQKKRLQVLNRDKFKCKLCSDDKTELHIHHLKYTGSNPWDAKLKDLQTLCKDCHSNIEVLKKEFPDISIHKIFKCKYTDNSILRVDLFSVHKEGVFITITNDGVFENGLMIDKQSVEKLYNSLNG